jgi:hypothetical protein
VRDVRASRRIYTRHRERKIPLSPEETRLIVQKLLPANSEEDLCANIIDPFCGNGNDLVLIADQLTGQGIKTKTYGIEEDKDQCRHAKTKITKAVIGKYEDILCTNGTFSLLFINPPTGAKNPVGIPREIIAFGDLTLPGKYLHAGAVLIFIAQREILPSLGTLLPQRFENISYFHVSQERVCIMGVRSKGRVDKELAQQQKETLLNLDENILDLSEDITYRVVPSKNEVTTFRNKDPEDEELAENISYSSLWPQITEMLIPKSRLVKTPKPMLALNETRTAIAAAAGVINGRAGDHFRMGITKEIKDTIVVDDGDSVTTVETQRHVSRVRIFCQEGVYDLEY